MPGFRTADQLFERPSHPYTRALLSAKPKEHPDQDSDRIILRGDVPNAMEIPEHCRFHTRCPEFIEGRCDCEDPKLVEIEHGHLVLCHLAAEIDKT